MREDLGKYISLLDEHDWKLEAVGKKAALRVRNLIYYLLIGSFYTGQNLYLSCFSLQIFPHCE